MPIYKNVGSQKMAVFAFDKTTGDPVTGDAAQITAQISKDGGASAASNDTNPTELDATDHPGIYLFDLTQAETNADLIDFQAASSTGDVVFDPIAERTEPFQFIPVDRPVPMQPVVASQAITHLFETNTVDVDTGAMVPTDVTSIAGTLYVEGDATAEVVTITNLDTGEYSAEFSIPSDVSLADGLVVKITGTMSGQAIVSSIWYGTVQSPALTASDVNAQMLDVLTVDTFAQPGQEAPAATTTLGLMLRYLYKAFRNKVTQTESEFSLFADNGSTVDQKATVSDDGTTTTRGEIASGP